MSEWYDLIEFCDSDEEQQDSPVIKRKPVRRARADELLGRLRELSTSSPVSCIWDQWELRDFKTSDDLTLKQVDKWNTHKYNKNITDYCCLCGHRPIKNLNLMQNVITNHRAVIGSCCITKFGSKQIKREMKVKQGETEGKRYCEGCRRKLPDDLPTWKTYHRTCYFKK